MKIQVNIDNFESLKDVYAIASALDEVGYGGNRCGVLLSPALYAAARSLIEGVVQYPVVGDDSFDFHCGGYNFTFLLYSGLLGPVVVAGAPIDVAIKAPVADNLKTD